MLNDSADGAPEALPGSQVLAHSGRLAVRLGSLPERRQTTAFQGCALSLLALPSRSCYSGRRKGRPAGPARVEWEPSGKQAP